MEKVVLDTSVLVKWFVEEEGTDQALGYLDKIRSEEMELVVPEAALLELVNALLYGAGFSGQVVLSSLKSFLSLRPNIVPLSELIMEKTVEFAAGHSLAAYDALFVAVAELQLSFLVTADAQHHRPEISRWIKPL